MNDFLTHACEQVLRFTSVNSWSDLSEERKVQLAFNMGVVALGLNLTKEDGYDYLAATCKSSIPIKDFNVHLRSVITVHNVTINEENVFKQI